MRNRLLIACMLVALAFAGCRSVSHTPTPVKPSPAPAPVARQYMLINFTGVVDGVSVSGQMRVAQDSAMWISVNKFIEVGRAMATQDSLWLNAPLLGREDAMNYDDMHRLTRSNLTFDQVQALLLGDDPEAGIAEVARQFGIDMRLRITRREQVPHLTFPFTKPTKR